MNIKTRVAVALCVPLLTIAGAGTAFAGEISGPPRDGYATGDWTPIADYVANSICAFSGLNAYHPAGGGFPEKEAVFPTVQSYGMFVRAGLKTFVPSPGEACNGHTGELTGP
ncbi:MAG TPA: hypothetical protein VIL87_06510 [Dermatophilaceae bacterium]|jgi:hypothetical protein